MDRAGALAVAGTTARMPVPGNAEYLLKQVLSSQTVPEGKAAVAGHHPPAVFLRPVEALHLVSLVTAPAYSADDLHDAYARWVCCGIWASSTMKQEPRRVPCCASVTRAPKWRVTSGGGLRGTEDRLRSPFGEYACQERGKRRRTKASADSLEPEEQLTSGEPISSLMPDGSICFCPFAGDAAVFSYYGSTGTRGGRETIRPSGSSWSPSSSNTTPLHSRLQPWSG